MLRNIIQRRLQSVLQKRPVGSGKAWRKRAAILCGVIIATLVLGHLGVRFLLWPQIEKSKPAIEKLMSARLGADITIDELEVSWTGIRPRFEITGLRFNAADKKAPPLLAIKKISGGLSWNSLYHLAPYFEDLHFQGAQIYAQRDHKGVMSIAGIPINGNDDDYSAGNWLLDQADIQIGDAQFFWQDHQGKKLNTSINIFQFHLTNGIRIHKADLTVSAPWSTSPIKLQAEFVHRLRGQPGNWRDWIGHFSWDLIDLNLNQLADDFTLPLNTLTGKISSKGDLNLEEGLADGAQFNLDANQLRVQLNKNEGPIEFGHLEADLTQANNNGLLSIHSKNFAWRDIDSPSNAPLINLSPMTFRWRPPGPDGEIREFGFSSPKIDVADAVLFALNLPLSKKVHQWIKASQAEGELQDLELNWSEKKSALAVLPIPGSWINPEKLDFMIKAKLIDLSFAAINKSMPSISHLSGTLYGDEKGGNFLLGSKNIEIEIHDFLEDPKIKLDTAEGAFSWTKQRGQWAIEAKQLALKNSDIATTLNLSYLLGAPKQPDQMVLDMKFSKANMVTAYRYLPTGMSKDARQYLEKSFGAGTIEQGTLHIKGDPDEIPFSKPNTGEFSLHLPIIGATFKPAPLLPSNQGIWQAFSNVNGALNQENSVVNIDISSANYKHVALSNIHAQIPNVSSNQLMLNLKGAAQGDAVEMLDYLFASPIGKQQPELQKNLGVNGPIHLDLGIELPLSGSGDPHIDAKLILTGNRVQWSDIPPIENLMGKIRLTEVHPEFEDVTANFLGGLIKISNAPSAANVSSFKIAGDVSAKFIKTYFAENFKSGYAPVLNAMSGSATYEGALNFNKSGSETNLQFDLRNWVSAAPVPAKKSAGTPMLGQISIKTYANTKTKNSTANKAEWSGKLGDAYFMAGALGADNELRQAIGIGANASLPSQGLNLNLVSNDLDLDAWREFMNAGSKSQNNLATAPSLGDASSTHVNAQVKNLTLLNRLWTNFTLDGANKSDGWRFRLTSSEISGRVDWRDPSEENPSGLISGRLTRLKIPDSISETPTVAKSVANSKRVNQKVVATQVDLKPNAIPSLNVSIEDFSWSKAQLGSIKIKTHTHKNGLDIESIQVSNPEDNSKLSGLWSIDPKDGSQKSVLNIDMDIKNAGQIVSHWTNTKSIEGGNGKLSGKAQWNGSPYAPSYESLSGNVDLYLEKGRLLEVNTDAAKLLNVLSLQSLFRFATLDLQGGLGSIVTKGTPFNSIVSNFTVTNGIANTNQFTMELDQARVAMTGQINIPNETQDLRVTVFPTLDAAAGSIVAAFVVNPIVGLSALVGQYLITNQINRSMQSDYLIQGSWNNPEVIPLDQKGQPLDPKTLESIRQKALLKEQAKPSAPNSPSAQPPVGPAL
jgi:uncharacterized protein (TIGR02099 family)